MHKKNILKKRLPVLALSALLAASSLLTGCETVSSSSSSASGQSTTEAETTSGEEAETVSFTVVPYTSRGIYVASAYALNTYIAITFYNAADAELADGCGDLLYYYEHLLSRTIETSEISLLNTRKIDTVSDDTAELIERGLYYSALSEGAYDVAIATLTSLWDFNTEDPVVPDADDIQEAVKWVDYTAVQQDGNKITFSNDQTGLDLGSIAKGYIADKLRDYLVEKGVENAIISLGGNLVMIGSKPDGNNYAVGLQLPFGDTNYDYFAIIRGSDVSVVTSGVYERYFKAPDGTYYHHLLNPNTGYSYDNGIYSVSIIGPCSTDCDGLSTTLFSMGLEDGMKLINSIDGYYAVYYMSDGTIYTSDGLEDAYSYEEVEHEYYSFDHVSDFS